MTIVRWDSSRDMAALQEGMSRVLEGFYRRPQEDLNRGAWVPVVDIYSNGGVEEPRLASALARSRRLR